MDGAAEIVRDQVLAWEGVQAQPHRFNAIAYVVGRREIGHVHGDQCVDIPFPSEVHQELLESGQVESHPFAPDSGWSRITLSSEADVERALRLMHRSYENQRNR